MAYKNGWTRLKLIQYLRQLRKKRKGGPTPPGPGRNIQVPVDGLFSAFSYTYDCQSSKVAFFVTGLPTDPSGVNLSLNLDGFPLPWTVQESINSSTGVASYIFSFDGLPLGTYELTFTASDPSFGSGMMCIQEFNELGAVEGTTDFEGAGSEVSIPLAYSPNLGGLFIVVTQLGDITITTPDIEVLAQGTDSATQYSFMFAAAKVGNLSQDGQNVFAITGVLYSGCALSQRDVDF